MERWERRERKKRAEAEQMPKSGASVRVIAQILAQRAAEAKAKREEEAEWQPSRSTSHHRKRRR